MLASPAGFEVFVFAVSIAAGVFGALLGLGGGILIVPVLTLGLGINIRYAVGASLVAVIGTSSGAAAAYVRDRLTNVRLAILLEMATTTGALLGVFVSGWVSPRYLFGIFGGVLLYSAFAMLKGRDEHSLVASAPGSLADRLHLSGVYEEPRTRRKVSYGVSNVGLGLVMMGGAGLLSSLLGIGSGILKVPAMDRIMRLPIKVSSATSNFMIGVTAAASAGAYFMKGDIHPVVAAPVALGALIGAWGGSRIMPMFPGRTIRKIFVVVLVIVAVQMVSKGLRGGV